MMSQKTFKLEEIATLTNSKLVGDKDYQISNVADLENAGPHDAAFLGNLRYEGQMRQSQAGVIFVTDAIPLIENRNFLINKDPSLAFQKTLEALFDQDTLETTGFEGIHPTAVIHPTCHLGKNVCIGPCTVIDKDCRIGDGCHINAHCYIGPRTTVGNDCLFHPRVTIRERCQIGNRVILQPGVVIGSCGFGYIQDKQGRHIKLNQVGIVVLEDDVEIGANTTIDRARFQSTLIKRGTKIDNLVQIGHGVIIGQDNIIVSQTGIAGSSQTGNWVMIGGQAAVAGHIKIGDRVMIAARAGVTKSIKMPGKYGGVPACPLNTYNRISVYLNNIETFVKELRDLKAQVAQKSM